MPSNQWFRMYSEFADDPKVQSMSEAMQRRLVMLFCQRSSDVLVTLCDADLAFHWRISNDDLADTKTLFMQKGFIDEYWNILNWNKRQYISDSSTERTRAYRERKRTSQAASHVTVVTNGDALDTDTEADSETETETETETTLALTPPGIRPADPPPLVKLPTNEAGKDFPVTHSQVQEWKSLYPAIDVMQQLRNMRGWLQGNSRNRKTSAGMARFIHAWLAKEQNRARPPAASTEIVFTDVRKRLIGTALDPNYREVAHAKS